jgi:hypothetical protein
MEAYKFRLCFSTISFLLYITYNVNNEYVVIIKITIPSVLVLVRLLLSQWSLPLYSAFLCLHFHLGPLDKNTAPRIAPLSTSLYTLSSYSTVPI